MKRNMLNVMMVFIMSLVLFTSCSKEANSKVTNTKEKVGDSIEVSTAPTDIYVFIAASLNNAMTKLVDTYNEIHPNINIILNADSSGTLQTQIEEGAECDIFFSAAMKQMKSLDEGEYLKAGSIKKLLENKVVLIKPIGTQTKVTGFKNIYEASNIALAGEDVPVGAYAREIFNYLGIWERIERMEINEAANVSAVLAAVSEASNEVGVVYATDANSVKDFVEIIAEAPAESLTNPVIYPVGLVKNVEADTLQEKASNDFLEFLTTKEALQVFEEYGFYAYTE